jgi:preprotein translocase subunit SecY
MEVVIENVRPGKQTFFFLKRTIMHLTVIGSIFLGILGTFANTNNTAGFGITSLIILVGVIIDITRQIQKKSF